ncbi:MAG: hypothetical protein DI534_10850 [Leifsonia xyli]|nr:MAG: hypothetical protein DI534_10850 [Leifsonia xyli]
MRTALVRETGEGRRRLAYLAAGSFSLLIAAGVATAPLMPLYRDVLGFAPSTMALTYVSYVGAQILTLLALSRLRFAKRSPALICVAVAIALASSMMMTTGAEVTILIGRFLIGVACGLATGAASVIVVDALGQRGRSITSIGNVFGALFGTCLAQLMEHLGGAAAIATTFQIHAGVCLVVLIGLLASSSGWSPQFAAETEKAPAEHVAPNDRVPMAFVVGSLSWLAFGAAITFAPTFFNDADLSAARDWGLIVMFSASAVAQLCSSVLARWFPAMTGLIASACGLMLVPTAAYAHSQTLAVLSLSLFGFGVGVSYRTSLVVVMRHAAASAQGAAATLYASVTYAICAGGVMLAGLWADHAGISAMVSCGFVALAFAGLFLVRSAPRLAEASGEPRPGPSH